MNFNSVKIFSKLNFNVCIVGLLILVHQASKLPKKNSKPHNLFENSAYKLNKKSLVKQIETKKNYPNL